MSATLPAQKGTAMRFQATLMAALFAAAMGIAACDDTAHVAVEERSAAEFAAPTGTLTAELVVAAPANLPACNTARAGTTALVTQGSLLYTCARNAWTKQTCTVDRAGEVAFVTGESFLLACSAKTWNQVAIPAGGPGSAGPAGLNSLVSTAPEAAGTSCAQGGLRVNSGADTDRDAVLDANEITATSFVCNGTSGTNGGASAPVRAASTAATLAQCAAGGQVVHIFQDANANGVEDSGESSGAPVVVCNGDPVAANGQTPIVKAYRGPNDLGVVAGEGDAGTRTVLSASITVPRAGTVLALGSSMAYCSGTSVPADQAAGRCASAAAGSTYAWLTVVSGASVGQAGNSGEAVATSTLQSDTDTQISVMATFEVGAGSFTYNMLGMAGEYVADAAATQIYFGVSELTLVFIPN